jgi:hypothetical protein
MRQTMEIKSASIYPASAPDVATETRLGSISSKVSQLNGFFAENATRLRNFTSRTLGSELTKDGQAAPRPVPNGSLDEIAMALSDLHDIAATQADLLNRLERIG